MVRRSSAALIACCLASFALVFSDGQLPESSAAGNKAVSKKPIRNPKFDPSGEPVEFFAAIEAGQIEAKLIPKNALGGTVLSTFIPSVLAGGYLIIIGKYFRTGVPCFFPQLLNPI